MRIFAISDLHIDARQNRVWLDNLSGIDYTADTLILAGDISDCLDRLESTLGTLARTFARVFFVPGNHELWVRKGECAHSLDKFQHILDLCRALNIGTTAEKIDTTETAVWIVPLFSWYEQPEEGSDSLFMPKPGEDPTLRMWNDNRFTHWPALNSTVAGHFLNLNEAHLQGRNGAPVISFSHFLPRADLIFSTAQEKRPLRPHLKDLHPAFNFSRVAGSRRLERQIRKLGSTVHIYGHQHRNRHRHINGTTYVSHCLGYHRERERGLVCTLQDNPRLIWDRNALKVES